MLNLAKELGNAAKVCQMTGVSRNTFHRYKDTVEDVGLEALLDSIIKCQTWKIVQILRWILPLQPMQSMSPLVTKSGYPMILREQSVYLYHTRQGLHSIWLQNNLANLKEPLIKSGTNRLR